MDKLYTESEMNELYELFSIPPHILKKMEDEPKYGIFVHYENNDLIITVQWYDEQMEKSEKEIIKTELNDELAEKINNIVFNMDINRICLKCVCGKKKYVHISGNLNFGYEFIQCAEEAKWRWIMDDRYSRLIIFCSDECLNRNLTVRNKFVRKKLI